MNAAARELLEVDDDATEENVLKAFRKKAIEEHPDKGGTHEGFLTLKSARNYLLGKEPEFKNTRPEKPATRAKTTREKKTRRKKEKPLPKKPTDLESWLEAKVEHPKFFKVDKDGDLVVPPYNAGESEIVIEITPKAPATPEHIKSFFEQRTKSLKEAEEAFATAKRQLKDIYVAYKREQATLDEVLEANHAAATAEAALNSLVKYPRAFRDLKGLVANDLNFDWYRRMKIPVQVGTMESSVFPWKAFWTTAPEAIDLEDIYEEVEDENEAALKGGAKPKRNLTAQQRAIIANLRRKRFGGGH